MIPIVFWIAMMVIMFFVEAATASLVSIWFAGGALVALVAAMIGGSVLVQFVVFTAVSALLLACLWPLRKRLIQRGFVRTNADRVIGMTAVVTERIDNLAEAGAVRVDGKVWTARSTDNTILETGDIVLVERMEGVKLYVKKAPVPVA